MAVDPFFANVKLLLGFEGADGATGAPGMTDESPAAHGDAASINGAQIDTAQFKFGTASLLNNGTNSGIHYNDSDDWALSNSNSAPFTVECWARTTTTTPTNKGLLWSGGIAGTLSWIFWVNTGTQLAFWGSTDTNTFNWTVTSVGITWSTGVWYHLAADKDATGKVRVYRDGVMVASATPANSVTANAITSLRVGDDPSNSRSWPGWIDEVRITKGVARYASDAGYSVPTEAFPRTGVDPITGMLTVTDAVDVPAFAGSALDMATGVLLAQDAPDRVAVEGRSLLRRFFTPQMLEDYEWQKGPPALKKYGRRQ